MFTAGASQHDTFGGLPATLENHLPPRFFLDRQRNSNDRGKLTYYIDFDVMSDWMARLELEGKFGVRIGAQPAEGYAFHTARSCRRETGAEVR